MKNIKSNSRFSILTQEISNVDSKKSRSNDRPNNRLNNRPNNRPNNLFKSNYKPENDIKLQKKELNFFSEEDFPTLGGVVSNNKENNTIKNSYQDMVKKENIKKVEKNDALVIKPGTIQLKFNRKSREIESTIYTDGYKMTDYEKQQEEGYAVLNGLVNLHERRTNNYINNWGYDEWEKIFRFPNYDYYYFDRLDELYQEELEKELEKEEEFNKLQDELDEYEDYIYNYE